MPAFLPDATLGVVRCVDSRDLEECGIPALVMNTYHLMIKPGSTTINSMGGLHSFSGWRKPILTDSGGFQAFSLVHQNPKMGYFSNDGITFQPEGAARKYKLTPEKCIQLQMGYGSDILVCLDDCTHIDAPESDQENSVQRTITWAKRCKKEFIKLLDQKQQRSILPKLFAVVQGGGIRSLRKKCAEALLDIGFDGYGFGGWPLDSHGNLLTDILGYSREIIPAQFPMHALGVGHPLNIARCYRLGYDLFDSAMPTRDARHGRLMRFTSDMPSISPESSDWFEYVYIHDEKYIRSDEPLSATCDCHTCQSCSLGFLRHLFKIEDSLYLRLATIHNLRFITRLMEKFPVRDE